MKQDIIVNALPVTTWNHMEINHAAVSWPETGALALEFQNGMGRRETAAPELPTGAGADAVFKDAPVWSVTAESGENVWELVTGDGPGRGVLWLRAKKGSRLTVYTKLKGREGDAAALRLLLTAEERAGIRLIELLEPGQSGKLLHDVGGTTGAGAEISLLHLYLGKGDLYSGARMELEGAKSGFTFEAGYLEQGHQLLDVNLIANHIGPETTCQLRADGTLKDAAQKTFRGTIDFKRGARGAVGAETENVLLLGEDVVNKTVPLILCAEEDVQGDHGATIGELDEDTLFYFATRGIDTETAENLLTREKLERLCEKLELAEMRSAAGNAIEEVLA